MKKSQKLLDLLKNIQNSPLHLVQYYAKSGKAMPGSGGQEWLNKFPTNNE